MPMIAVFTKSRRVGELALMFVVRDNTDMDCDPIQSQSKEQGNCKSCFPIELFIVLDIRSEDKRLLLFLFYDHLQSSSTFEKQNVVSLSQSVSMQKR